MKITPWPALLGAPLGDGRLRCDLCPHRCQIGEGQTGQCGVRANLSGQLALLTYGLGVTQAVEPIEKKPFYHFYPGSQTFSLAAVGCNLACAYCQNWEIAQLPRSRGRIAGQHLSAEMVVDSACKARCEVVCFTYTEPIVALEYVLDVARLARKAGLRVALLTGGYITQAGLELLIPEVDAVKVDVKAADDTTYRRLVGGRLRPVLNALRGFRNAGVWVEVSTVLVPGLLDRASVVQSLADLIQKHAGSETPWHLARFFPNYHLQGLAPGDLGRLLQLHGTARAAGLRHVYLSNVPGMSETTTDCQVCGEVLIRRPVGQRIQAHLNNGRCPVCATELPGRGFERSQIWMD